MKTWMMFSLLLAGLACTGNVLAADHGDRIERRLDHRGDRIEARYDRRAIVVAAHGRYARAAYLERKGERIDKRLDRKGKRYDRRWDRHHGTRG